MSKTVVVVTRFTPSEKADVERLAKLAGMSVAAYIRAAALGRVQPSILNDAEKDEVTYNVFANSTGVVKMQEPRK